VRITLEKGSLWRKDVEATSTVLLLAEAAHALVDPAQLDLTEDAGAADIE